MARPGARGASGPRGLALLVAAAAALVPADRGCAPPCFCFATPDTLQCRLGRLAEPPSGLPAAVRNLSIVGGNLTVLRAGAFSGGAARPLAQLSLLVLTHDGIEALEAAAFAGLPALATLDLSHNALRAVAPGAFAGCARLRTLRLNQALPAARDARDLARLLGGALRDLPGLARLELAGNGLRELPPGSALPPALRLLDVRNNSLQALAGAQLEALGRARLRLAANPLRCDCASLRPWLLWRRNATDRDAAAAAADGEDEAEEEDHDDARELRCASPPALRGRAAAHLRRSQLDCPEGDAAAWGLLEEGEADEPETASYVVFGVVLALIGVLFLMVLYLNRRGIKRWLGTLHDACRDQMEGYQYRYEQDSDPRRAGPGGDL